MPAFLHTMAVWLRRTFAWSNTRQSWLERGAGLVWLTLAALAYHFSGRLGVGQRLLLVALLLLSLVMLLRRGWVKLLGPVFIYDAVRSARRGRYFLVRGIYTGIILGLLCWTYFIWRLRSVDGAIPSAELVTFAESFFYVFLAVQGLAVILLTPAFVAGAIAEEKERQTLDYLLATDLRNREIVLGKLVSRLGNLALLVLAGLPILSLMEMLGGVEPRLVVGAFAITGITLVTLAAFSLLCSVHARRARDAILATYLLVVAYQGLTLAFLGVVRVAEIQQTVVVPKGVLPWLTRVPQEDPLAEPVEDAFTLGDLADRVNDGTLPMFCYRLGEEVARGSTVAEALPHLLRDYAVVNLTLAGLCIVWSVRMVRRVALRQRHRASVPLRGIAVIHRPAVGRRPFLWKEAIAESGFRTGLSRRTSTYLTFIAVAVPTGILIATGARELTRGWVGVLVVVVPIVSLLAVAVRASAAVSGERDRQTLESLLSIPVSSDVILFTKWLGCLVGVRWTVLAVALALAVCAAIGGPSIMTMVWLMLVWPIYAGLVAMIGIAFSVACKTTLRATLATLLMTTMLSVGHWALWLVYVPFLLAADAPSSPVETLRRLHLGLTPPVVLARIAATQVADTLDDPDGHLYGFTLVGLAIWLTATVLVWFLASRQFRIVSNRGPMAPPGPPPAEAEAAAIMRALARRGRLRRRIVVATALLLPPLATVGVYVYVSRESERRLRAVVAELDAAEPGWRLADLEAARKKLPVEENSAEQVRKVRGLMPRPWPGPILVGRGATPQIDIFTRLAKVPPQQQLSLEDEEELREALAQIAPAREEALKLADMPEGRYPITWASSVMRTTLNDLQESRAVSQLLRAESAYRAQAGDSDGAVRAARAALNVARAIGDEPLLMSQFVRMAERRVAVETLERALGQGEAGEAELARMQAALEVEEREPLLIYGYRIERAFYHEAMEELRTGKFKASQMWSGGAAQDLAAVASSRSAHPWGLLHLNRLVALKGRPLHEQLAEAAAIDREAINAPWVFQQMMGNFGTSSIYYRRRQSGIRCAIVAVAAERFRRQRGRWPESMEALVPIYLPIAALDPADGQPLRWLRRSDGIVIYSIGVDAQDNVAGKLDLRNPDDASFELGVRLWDVEKRRQKAAAPGKDPGPRGGP